MLAHLNKRQRRARRRIGKRIAAVQRQRRALQQHICAYRQFMGFLALHEVQTKRVTLH